MSGAGRVRLSRIPGTGHYLVSVMGTGATLGTVVKGAAGWTIRCRLPEPDEHGRTTRSYGWTYSTRAKAVEGLIRSHASEWGGAR